MFGIPTVTVDYTNDVAIFDPYNPHQFQLDLSLDRDKNLYLLNKAMTIAYRKAGIPNSTVKEVVARNATQILDALLNPAAEVEDTDVLDVALDELAHETIQNRCNEDTCGCSEVIPKNFSGQA